MSRLACGLLVPKRPRHRGSLEEFWPGGGRLHDAEASSWVLELQKELNRLQQAAPVEDGVGLGGLSLGDSGER